MLPTSRNSSVSPSKAPVSGMLSLAFGTAPVLPHGYWPISSECASTRTRAVRVRFDVFVSLRPSSAPRRPSGTKSVRSSRKAPIAGNSARV